MFNVVWESADFRTRNRALYAVSHNRFTFFLFILLGGKHLFHKSKWKSQTRENSQKCLFIIIIFFPRRPVATFCVFEQHVGCRILVGFCPRENTFKLLSFHKEIFGPFALCVSVGSAPSASHRKIWKTKKNYEFIGIRVVNVLSNGVRRPTLSVVHRMEGHTQVGGHVASVVDDARTNTTLVALKFFETTTRAPRRLP